MQRIGRTRSRSASPGGSRTAERGRKQGGQTTITRTKSRSTSPNFRLPSEAHSLAFMLTVQESENLRHDVLKTKKKTVLDPALHSGFMEVITGREETERERKLREYAGRDQKMVREKVQKEKKIQSSSLFSMLQTKPKRRSATLSTADKHF